VIASNVGGIPLQIEHEKTGILVDPEDKKTAAKNVIKVLENPEWGEELGKQGKEYIRKHFLITRLIKDYLRLMSEVLL
jgi:trehalose synthase